MSDEGPAEPVAAAVPPAAVQPAAARADAPPDDAAGPSTSASRESFDDQAKAYEEGRRTLRPLRDTHITGGAGQDVQIGDRIYFQGARSAAPDPGPVRPERLADLQARYVPVPGRDRMLKDLGDRHLLVITGRPGSGRSTTALHLLDTITNGSVSRMDAATDVRTIGEDRVGTGSGYLAEISDARQPSTEAEADRIAALFERRSSYCVIVTSPTAIAMRAFGAYRADCPPPDADTLLSRHIDARLLSSDPYGTRTGLMQLAASGPLDALGPAPRPSEVAGLAELLVEHLRQGLSIDDVSARAGGFLEHRIGEWFASIEESSRRDITERRLRRAALRIALAVFDGLPRHVVVRTAGTLGTHLIRAVIPTAMPGMQVTSDPDTTLLAELEAETTDSEVRFGGVPIPAVALKYSDNRVPSTLLSHVWQHHHAMRAPIVDWLAELSRDPQLAVRVRAAQAAGLLASVDFSHTFPALIEPAALARPGRRRTAAGTDREEPDDDSDDDSDATWELSRVFAAMALDQAALDDRLRPVVESTLRRWRRSSDVALRWTAARARGLEVGQREVAAALDELRVIGTPWELLDIEDVTAEGRPQVWDLRWVSGLGVARLFANGAYMEVLTRLDGWLRHQRKSVRQLAQQAVVVIAELRMSAVTGRTGADGSATPEQPGRDRWPVVLGLVTDYPAIVPPLAHILRQALHSPAADVLLDVMGSWLDSAASDPAALDALLELLPALVIDEDDRRRLEFAVRRRRKRWADPLPDDVADRLDDALIATLG